MPLPQFILHLIVHHTLVPNRVGGLSLEISAISSWLEEGCWTCHYLPCLHKLVYPAERFLLVFGNLITDNLEFFLNQLIGYAWIGIIGHDFVK